MGELIDGYSFHNGLHGMYFIYNWLVVARYSKYDMLILGNFMKRLVAIVGSDAARDLFSVWNERVVFLLIFV